MPQDDDWETFDAGQEYEAKNTLPLFWLCMFSEESLEMTEKGVENGEVTESYPYALAQQSDVLKNLAQRRTVIACLDPARLALYDSFCSRVSTATHPYWLLRTKELVGMSDAETFAQELIRTFDGLEEYRVALQKSDAARLRDSWFAAYLADVKQNHSSYMLSGASTDSSWLPHEVETQTSRSISEATATAETTKTEKKWWQFWK
jgi:hypothetical protein